LDIGQRLAIGHKIFRWYVGYFYLCIEQSRTSNTDVLDGVPICILYIEYVIR
jgi:hypothetical protein